MLAGDLGAGKTTFTQGHRAPRSASTEPVVSPTFTIVREYEGRVPLVHVDVYRLDHLQEVLDLGLEEILDGTRSRVVEWGDVVGALLPAGSARGRVSSPHPTTATTTASSIVVPHGPAWAARRRAARRRVAPRGG